MCPVSEDFCSTCHSWGQTWVVRAQLRGRKDAAAFANAAATTSRQTQHASTMRQEPEH